MPSPLAPSLHALQDPTLSYPAEDSSVPGSALYVLVFVLPAVVFAVAAWLKRWAAPNWAFVDWCVWRVRRVGCTVVRAGKGRWTKLCRWFGKASPS